MERSPDPSIAMFDDVDNTLQSLLTLLFGAPLPFSVSFAIPNNEFKPVDTTQTTLNCYLYDIREDRDLRTIEPTLVRNNDGSVTKTYPPIRVKVSYCITAWSPAAPNSAVDPTLEEHKLLGQVLAGLLQYPTLPPPALQGSLTGQTPPLPTTIIRPEDMRANRDFWNALGGTLRPALDYSITISMPYQAPVAGVQVLSAQFSVTPLQQPALPPAPARLVIAGTVWNVVQTPTPVVGAWVRVQETGQTDVTDANGQFRIGPLSAGTYTLSARAPNFVDAVAGPLPVPPVPPPQGSPAPTFGYYDLQMTPS